MSRNMIFTIGLLFTAIVLVVLFDMHVASRESVCTKLSEEELSDMHQSCRNRSATYVGARPRCNQEKKEWELNCYRPINSRTDALR